MTTPHKLLFRVVLIGVWMVFYTTDLSAQLKRVSFTERGDGRGIVVRLHLDRPLEERPSPATYRDNRVTVVLPGVSPAWRVQYDAVKSPVQVLDVNVVDGDTYVLLSLIPGGVAAVQSYGDGASNDFLINLTRHEPAPAVPVRPVSEAYTPSEAARDRWLIDKIVLDAGHGGKDPGSIGINGLREKDVVLDITRQVGSLLSQAGVDVVYTRDDDTFLELHERGAHANAEGGKLFVSIHANWWHTSQPNGAEVYFLGMHKSDAAHDVMERENSVVRFEEDQDHYAQLNQSELIRMTLTQSAFLHYSEVLSTQIEERFRTHLGLNSRGVKQAGFYVLWGASMPAVLIELGFITNPTDHERMRTSSGRRQYAEAIAASILGFREQYQQEIN